MSREYLVKDEDCNFFCCLINASSLDSKGKVLMTDPNNASSFMRLRKFKSLADAKETAKMLAESKWLESKGKVFEVVEAQVSELWTEDVYTTWWSRLFGIPHKTIVHHPDVVSYVTVWSTAD